MTFPKSIKMFLMNGSPAERLSCELSNWTGKAYKIPRSMVKMSTDRSELSSPGVYILFGENSEDTDKKIAYIGES